MIFIKIREHHHEYVVPLSDFIRLIKAGTISPGTLVNYSAWADQDFRPAKELEVFREHFNQDRFHFKRYFHLGRAPILTVLMTVAWSIIFFAAKSVVGELNTDSLLYLGAISSSKILEEASFQRLFLANLMHTDTQHLLFNMITFFSVSILLEAIYKRGHLLLFYTSCAILSMSVSAVFSDAITVGASGLVFGCLSCLVAFTLRFQDILAFKYRFFLGVLLFFYTCCILYLNLNKVSVDHLVHASGLVIGIVAAFILKPRHLMLGASMPRQDSKNKSHALLIPYIVVIVIISALFSCNLILKDRLITYKKHVFEEWHLQLLLPQHWQEVTGTYGHSFSNKADAMVSLFCENIKVDQSASGNVVLNKQARKFEIQTLVPLVEAQHFWSFKREDFSENFSFPKIESSLAMLLRFEYEVEDGKRLVEASFVIFDRFENTSQDLQNKLQSCTLLLIKRPRAAESAAKILEKIRDSLEYTNLE